MVIITRKTAKICTTLICNKHKPTKSTINREKKTLFTVGAIFVLINKYMTRFIWSFLIAVLFIIRKVEFVVHQDNDQIFYFDFYNHNRHHLL
jgi:hypothetical protein